VTYLSSTANPRIRSALALRDRRDRERTGLTIVDGIREIGRALDAGIEVAELFAAPERCLTPDCASLLARVASWTPVAPAVIDRLAYGDRAEGAVAVIRSPPTALAGLEPPPDPLLVVLEGVEKPGNVGAVLRSIDGAGGHALLLADPGTDPFNPNTIRASLGTIFGIPIAVAGAADARAWLGDRGIRIVAARVDADLDYSRVSYRGGLALVLGSEARGLGPAWHGAGVEAVRLPMHGVADSLNVSAAAAVLLYEAQRQRVRA
jgi:TrmH family RNA methyltransferase